MQKSINLWKEAIIDACVINFIDWDEDDPYKTLAALVKYECDLALDRRVSSKAQELYEEGFSDGLKHGGY